MPLAMFAHFADTPSQLRVWIGAVSVGALQAADLVWTLNGQAAQPTALQALRTWTLPGRAPFYSGIFQFDGLAADTSYQVALRIGQQGERIVRTLRTRAIALPAGPQDRFKVLLLSCFHFAEDTTGIAGHTLSRLSLQPNLTILAGDQVYLDMPAIRDFPDDENWLEAKFQDDYLNNWFNLRDGPHAPDAVPNGYPTVLSQAPLLTMADDHEYWNNSPFLSPFIQNTWTAHGRQRWREAAQQAFTFFQQGSDQPIGAPRVIQQGPLSILMLDTRTRRALAEQDNTDVPQRQDVGDLLGPVGRQALMDWARDLADSAQSAQPRYGVLVTGQSLFRLPAGLLTGTVFDYELADYAPDYAFMLTQLESVSKAGLPVLFLTGDVHWGRVLRAGAALGRAPLFEVFSSPTSLVTNPGKDQLQRAKAWIGGLFGPRDPWPRHGQPQDPPSVFGLRGDYQPQVLTAGPDKTPTKMRGNMAVQLGFAQLGRGVDVEVRYIPLHKDEQVNVNTQWTTSFRLMPDH